MSPLQAFDLISKVRSWRKWQFYLLIEIYRGWEHVWVHLHVGKNHCHWQLLPFSYHLGSCIPASQLFNCYIDSTVKPLSKRKFYPPGLGFNIISIPLYADSAVTFSQNSDCPLAKSVDPYMLLRRTSNYLFQNNSKVVLFTNHCLNCLYKWEMNGTQIE